MGLLQQYAKLAGKCMAVFSSLPFLKNECFKIGGTSYPVKDFLSYSPSKRWQIYNWAGLDFEQQRTTEEFLRSFAAQRKLPFNDQVTQKKI